VDPADLAVALLGGLVAGTMNAVVGAGSMVSFPLLLTTGLPPVTANATNTVGLLPGTLSAVAGYRRELAGRRWELVRLGAVAALGGAAGALLLLLLPAESFEAVVPFLLLLAAALTAVQPRVNRWLATHGGHHRAWGLLVVGVGLTAVYGGYFGAAQGVILLALIGALYEPDIQEANALKNAIALVANVVSGVLLAASGKVDWAIAAAVAVGALMGGLGGVRLARRLPPAAFRWFAIVVAVVAAVAIAVDTASG
jgi:uncharacterized membrane protein YfcA